MSVFMRPASTTLLLQVNSLSSNFVATLSQALHAPALPSATQGAFILVVSSSFVAAATVSVVTVVPFALAPILGVGSKRLDDGIRVIHTKSAV